MNYPKTDEEFFDEIANQTDDDLDKKFTNWANEFEQKNMIGTIVELKVSCLGNPAGTRGVVFNTYEDFDESGEIAIQVIFKNGEYDGFSVADQKQFLKIKDVGTLEHQTYIFRNVMTVSQDFRNGFWKDAFLDLGEMIGYWISQKGYLDCDTPEEEIIKFYKNEKQI